MKKLVIINGPTAVGKSTIIFLLRQKLKNYVFVDRAYVKQMLRPLSKKLRKELSTYVSLFLIKEAMKEKKNILTQEMSSEAIKKDAQKYNYHIFDFSLICSLDTALKRDKKRGGKTKAGTISKIYKKFENNTNLKNKINTELLSPNKVVDLIIQQLNTSKSPQNSS